MSNYSQFSERLIAALELSAPPVAVTFSDQVVANHSAPIEPVAAGCKFWEQAMTQALATTAADHANCAIGIHTHNLKGAPESQPTELEDTLAAMRGLDYVRPDEVAAIPVMPTSTNYVYYTPLAECSESPAAVLLFANAQQGLIVTEAIARVDGEHPASLGRPACAVIPQVVSQGRSAASLGCCGARAYIDTLDSGATLWALAGDKLAECVDEIEILAKANQVLSKFHELRQGAIASGATPSVAETLSKLS